MEEPENTNSINGLLLNDESKASESTNTKLVGINWIPIIFGIAVFLLGLIDMIVLFILPEIKIKENQSMYPDAIFEKPNIIMTSLHFSLHASLMIFGVVLILLGLKPIYTILDRIAYFGLIIAPSLVFIFWMVEIIIGFSLTKDPPSNKSIEQIQPYLINEHPANFAFVYSNDEMVIPNCYLNQKTGSYECTYQIETCYSSSGVSIPFSSQLASVSYDFKDSPDVFNLKIEQVINMSNDFEIEFKKIMWNINLCDEMRKVVDYYPLIAGTYVITNRLPTWLSHKTRVVTILFGVGLYYEMYTKSIPSIHYKQHIDIDIDPNFDYNNLWTNVSCFYYGKCHAFNPKPTPYSK